MPPEDELHQQQRRTEPGDPLDPHRQDEHHVDHRVRVVAGEGEEERRVQQHIARVGIGEDRRDRDPHHPEEIVGGEPKGAHRPLQAGADVEKVEQVEARTRAAPGSSPPSCGMKRNVTSRQTSPCATRAMSRLMKPRKRRVQHRRARTPARLNPTMMYGSPGMARYPKRASARFSQFMRSDAERETLAAPRELQVSRAAATPD